MADESKSGGLGDMVTKAIPINAKWTWQPLATGVAPGGKYSETVETVVSVSREDFSRHVRKFTGDVRFSAAAEVGGSIGIISGSGSSSFSTHLSLFTDSLKELNTKSSSVTRGVVSIEQTCPPGHRMSVYQVSLHTDIGTMKTQSYHVQLDDEPLPDYGNHTITVEVGIRPVGTARLCYEAMNKMFWCHDGDHVGTWDYWADPKCVWHIEHVGDGKYLIVGTAGQHVPGHMLYLQEDASTNHWEKWNDKLCYWRLVPADNSGNRFYVVSAATQRCPGYALVCRGDKAMVGRPYTGGADQVIRFDWIP